MQYSVIETLPQAYHWLASGHYIRTLHFHNTPRKNESLYRRQMQKISEYYEVLSFNGVKALLSGGIATRTPLVIGLFDGYRNNFDVMHPLLEEYGLCAWILLVTDFLSTPAAGQHNVLERYKMQWLEREYADGRYAMTWQEALLLSKRHTIVNHSATHFLLNSNQTKEQVRYEVEHAQEIIVQKLGIAPRIFSWLGGAGCTTNQAATDLLRQNGFQCIFGERLEYIGAFDGTSASAEMEYECCADAQCSAQNETQQYETLFTKLTIFHGVPALLPFYAVDGDALQGGTTEDLQLAKRFVAIAHFLMYERGCTEHAACQKARDIIAMNDFVHNVPVAF